MNKNFTTFYGGDSGLWKVDSITAIKGDSLDAVKRIEILQNEEDKNATWILKGFSSNLRYTNRSEKEVLDETPSILGRPEAKCAALIPIKKSEEWWLLPQDERRHIFENQSQHIQSSLRFLGKISRKLYHSRDIGEPFDFLTWFEFAPEYADEFNELVENLRQAEEWNYVVREVDIRLSLD